MIVTEDWERKTFSVKAVRVTADNFKDVAEWCGGKIVDTDRHPDDVAQYIEVFTGRVMNKDRFAQAWIGDWVTRINGGDMCRVYQNMTFLQAYQKICGDLERRKKIQEIVDRAVWTNMELVTKSWEQVIENYTDEIMGVFK